MGMAEVTDMLRRTPGVTDMAATETVGTVTVAMEMLATDTVDMQVTDMEDMEGMDTEDTEGTDMEAMEGTDTEEDTVATDTTDTIKPSHLHNQRLGPAIDSIVRVRLSSKAASRAAM
jgi:hypothetical protein